jgi:SAM-dependent methyltransferase
MIETKRSSCLGCAAPLGNPFLDLGSMPLANALLSDDDRDFREEHFPLALAYCDRCHLVQLTEVIPPEKLFSNYLYFSSYSDLFLEHSRDMAESYTERFALDSSSRVLEVASNDGYLLRHFIARGIKVLGVEPAANIAVEAVRVGIPTLNRFFGIETVPEIIRDFGRADLIIGNNVLAHVPQINGFLRAVASVMEPSGTAVFEFPHLLELLNAVEFDTIYHEHVFYFSLAAIVNLARNANLELFDVARQSVHGGSLRVFLQRPGVRPIEANVAHLLDAEQQAGLTSATRYAMFAMQVQAVKSELFALLKGLKAGAKRVAAYGAPAKGNTLLNYCGIGAETLDFTVDRSPHKQGKRLPGSHLRIFPPEALLQRKPDYTLILPWNIAEEIVAQQQKYLQSGGRFIVPIPSPRVIAV